MVIIEKLEKIYGKRVLFDNLNIKFEEKGLYGIIGESGSGKTTLLNMISSIDNDYYGRIIINGVNLKEVKENERRHFRYNNFGYIFQSFNLFEDETVYNNVAVVYEGNSLKSEIKKRNIDETLKELNIFSIKNEYVCNLSGGEKQRVAIARAIINHPKIILCDEPTGSLDMDNAKEIFKILKKISNSTLVIVVSHDVELINDYCDFIFNFKNKVILKNKTKYKDSDEFFIANNDKNKISKLSLKFILRNIKNAIKIKKFQYLLSGSIFSLSLICLGLTLFISNNVSESIQKAFGSIINENSLVLKKRNADMNIKAYSASKNDLMSLKYDYYKDIEHIGIKYLVNFPSYFVDENSFFIDKGDFSKKVNFLTTTNINEFSFLTDKMKYSNDFYPQECIDNALNIDEIILGLDYNNMEKFCKDLQIVRSYESLGNYLENNNVNLVLKVRNDSWKYSDEQLFKLIGIMQSPKTCILHTNEFFNEEVFENLMMLPSTNNLLEISKYPWILKKVYYFKTKTYQTQLINKISKDTEYKNFIFDSDNFTYSPSFCKVGELCRSNRVFVFRSLDNIFNSSIIQEIQNTNNKFKDYYYVTYFGYANYGNSLFNGFANPLYFSMDSNLINNLIAELEKIPDDLQNIDLNENIAQGYVLDTSSENVKFSIKYDGKYVGKETLELDEIAISSALAKKISDDDILNKEIFLSLNYESTSNGEYTFNKFKTIKLKIGGIVDSDRFLIYQKPEFSIYLFRDFFEISVFSLLPQGVVYEFDVKPSKEEINFLNNKFKEYEIIDPFEPINNNSKQIFQYINIGLIIFTAFSSISSIVLLFVISTINFEEEKRSIMLFKILGFSDYEISKLQIIKNFSYTMPSLFTSIISIIIISIFISKIIAKILGLTFAYSLPFYSILGIIALTIVLSMISFIFIYFYTKHRENYSSLH